MKKLLIVLLALTVMGFAFAQDAAPAPALAFSGSVQTGFQIYGGNGVDLSMKNVETNNPSSGSLWFDGTFTGAAMGAKFEMYSKADVTGPIMMDVLYGYWKPMSMLQVTAGYGFGSSWTTPIEGWYNDGAGLQLLLTPIDGLAVALDIDATAAGVKFDAAKGLGFDLVYTAKDIAKIGFDYDGLTKVVYGGLTVSAVPSLTALVDLKYDTNASNYRAEEKFAYAMGALTPGVWAFEQSFTGAAWGVQPFVTYNMGSVTPGIWFEYDDGSKYTLTLAADMTVEKNAIHVYFDYKDSGAYDLGLRYIVSF